MCENHVTQRRLTRCASRDKHDKHVMSTSRDKHDKHVMSTSRDKHDKHVMSTSRDKHDKHVMSTSRDKHVKKASAERQVRIVVAGPSGVGKSALVVRFLTKRFIGDYSPQESISERLMNLSDSLIGAHLWDTAASSCLREEYLSWADGLLLVFSLTDMHSFRHARAYAKQLTHLHRTNGIATLCYLSNYSKNYSRLPGLTTMCRPVGSTPTLRANHGSQNMRLPSLILVGNKSDLSQARQVSYVQARELAASLRCPYIETSASESSASVYRAFATVFEHIKLSEQSDVYNNNNNGKKPCFYGKSAVSFSGLKHHLKSLTDFRSRTNTF